MRQDWQPRRADAGGTLAEVELALTHRRRRLVVYELCQSEELSLGELADRLLTWEQFGGGLEDRSAVVSSLRQTHLPVLEAVNVVDYDASSQTATLQASGPYADQIRRLAIAQAQK